MADIPFQHSIGRQSHLKVFISFTCWLHSVNFHRQCLALCKHLAAPQAKEIGQDILIVYMPPLAPFLESSGNYWTHKALSLQLWTFCKVLLTSQLLPQFPCRWVAHSSLTWLAGNKRLWAAFHVPCRSSDRKSFALNLYFTIWQQVQNWLKSGVD